MLPAMEKGLGPLLLVLDGNSLAKQIDTYCALYWSRNAAMVLPAEMGAWAAAGTGT